MATFQLFFQSREQVVVWRGQIQRIGWVIKTLEAKVGQFLLSWKCLVNWGVVIQKHDPVGDLPAVFFLQNVIQLHQQIWVIIRIDSLALWKVINEEDTIDPKTLRQELFQRIFALGIFWGGVRRYAAIPLIVALSPHHRDVNRFHPWLPIATGNHFDHAETFQICSDDWHCWRFWSAFRHFRTHFTERFRMSKSSWMMDPTRSR